VSSSAHENDELDTPWESEDALLQQKREWLVERLGWVAMACFIAGALAGAFGMGPLAARERSNPQRSMRAKYSSVERAMAPSTLELWCSTERMESDQLEISISRTFLDEVTVESIVPAPASVAASEEAVVYSFALDSLALDRDRLGAEKKLFQIPIVWRYRHHEFGRVAFDVALSGQSPLRIQQWVLP
jgi:hypothetical protein